MTHSLFPALVLCGALCLFCRAAASPPDESLSWLTARTRLLLTGCQVKTPQGLVLYTPDGKGNYAALWTRDYSYMVESCFDLMPPENTAACIRYLLDGQRSDGCIPDRRQPDGVSVYCAGPPQKPVGGPPLDNSMFMVFLVADYVDHTKDLTFFRESADRLIRAMDYVPRSPTGLVWNDPNAPHSPYGFTDCVGKTGEQLFDSLLYWRACRRLAAYLRQTQQTKTADDMNQRAAMIEHNLVRLWDDAAGGFLAASIDCHQYDVWGNAYAIFINFPLGQRRPIVLKTLRDRHGEYLWHGQVRHLIRGQYWQRLLIPVQRERYQNGAYWATPSAWVIHALIQIDRDLARKTLDELLADFRAGGICECINADHRQLPDYVASGTNTLGLLRRVAERSR